MDLGPCPSCGLTPLGDRVLSHELDLLRRDRPEGSWVAEVCERCDGVCVIVDAEEGWTLGSASPGPVRRVGPSTGPEVEVSPLSFGEQVARQLPDPLVVIERIVAEVTGTGPHASTDPTSAPAAIEPAAPAPAPAPSGRTVLPASWAYTSK